MSDLREARTILAVFAHPDDESMGPGGTFAKAAAAGDRVLVSTVTAGGAGRLFADRPADETERQTLMELRKRETRAACEILGIEHLGFWGWEDGALADRDVLEAEQRIVALVREHRPDVLVSFHPAGISYHRDHRFVMLAAMGAFLGSGQADWYREEPVASLPPHRLRALYGYTVDRSAAYRDRWPRSTYGSPRDEISVTVDTREWADTRWAAIEAHASQSYGPPFRVLYESGAFEFEHWTRIFPAPRAGGPATGDLFEGLESFEDLAGE